MGVTFAIFHLLGTIPVVNDRFIRWVNGLERAYAAFCAMFVKKVQIDFTFSVFFTLSMLLVTEKGTDSFEGNISLMQFQNLAGLFLFPNSESF